MQPPKILGLVTIEDVIELIINDEIYDEGDFDAKFDQNAVVDQHEDHAHPPIRNIQKVFNDKFSKSFNMMLVGKKSGQIDVKPALLKINDIEMPLIDKDVK